ncbi:MAG: hypothetical protein Q9198_009223, partial [Flavoplaca austrocitrina]
LQPTESPHPESQTPNGLLAPPNSPSTQPRMTMTAKSTAEKPSHPSSPILISRGP